MSSLMVRVKIDQVRLASSTDNIDASSTGIALMSGMLNDRGRKCIKQFPIMAFSFSFDVKDGSLRPQQSPVAEDNAVLEDLILIPPSKVSSDIVEVCKGAAIETEASEFSCLKRRQQKDVIAALNADKAIDPSLLEAVAREWDVLDRRYEGGLKTWECSIDLCHYLEGSSLPASNQELRILELGCGHALPSIYLAKKAKVSGLTLQDYNLAVLKHVTIPNLVANGVALDSKVNFVYGDWRGLEGLVGGNGGFDVILAAETIYRPESYKMMADIIAGCLKAGTGVALVAAKDYYFGLGGTAEQFIRFINNCNNNNNNCNNNNNNNHHHHQYPLEAKTVHHINEHVARSIIQIRKK